MRHILHVIIVLFVWSCTGGNTGNRANNSPSANAGKAEIDGKTIYDKHCMECHQENGEGVPGIYPTLKNAEWVGAEKEHLIEIILNGLTKQIVVDGIAYEDEMPKADYLTNKEVAAVLTYIRTNFAGIDDPVSELEVARTRIRLKSKK